MRFFVLAAALAVTACTQQTPAATAPSLTCVAERAVYTLRGQPDATLRIVQPPHAPNAYSDLAVRVEFEGENYWFAFVSSLGFSRNYLGHTVDLIEEARREEAGEDIGEAPEMPDYGGSELVMFDAAYDVVANVPSSGDPAPAHILANGVASSIWYSVPRRQLPLALWDLSECADDVQQ